MVNIAIDGFAGSGKTTLVKALAKKLGKDFKVLDTGAIFRAFAYAYDISGYGKMTPKKIKKFLDETDIKVKFVADQQHVFIGDKDVSEFIRTEKISQMSSQISVFEEVRERYLQIAQTFAENYNCIMEGRDIGTIVMPNADIKIFLTADETVRAKRRLNDVKKTDSTVKLETILKDLQERDARDTNKGIYSLRPTETSVIVDNSKMTFEETVNFCLDIINKKLNQKKNINITLDGYVCSGKSTISKVLAKKLGFSVFDTGAIYRGVACAFDYMSLDEKKISEKYICAFARQINVRIEFIDNVQHVFVNGIDHTPNLRTERISALSAKISPFNCIREKVLKLQRDYAKNHNLVMEGRDIGSFVLPNADFKFFCTADENVRAKRRYEQQKAMGNDVNFADVLKELKERDYKDIHRDHGAVKIMPDSIIVDTTNQSLDQSVQFCLNEIKKKCPDIKILNNGY